VSDWLVVDSLAPHTGGVLAPLYEAAGRGLLALPHCNLCAMPLELEQTRCDECGDGGVEWTTVAPHGVVHSVTTVHRREPGLIVTAEPYHVVDVELDSGHRLLMTTVRPAADAPAIGDLATIAFRRVAGVPIPALASTRLPDNDSEVVR
jgi:uncharacterized OB-fold protein